jgi:hypothetical protein
MLRPIGTHGVHLMRWRFGRQTQIWMHHTRMRKDLGRDSDQFVLGNNVASECQIMRTLLQLVVKRSAGDAIETSFIKLKTSSQ